MFVSALIIFWLLTSIVIIPPDKQGIIRRFSKIIHKEPAGPGLHIKSPWPIDTVQLYTPQRVNILNIGFIPSKEKKHIIWTKPHAVENFNLVLGNGMEMISVDCQVMYKIKDLNNYVIQFQNPEQLIEAAAYRALTFETVGSTFDEVMVRDRSQFARALKNDIQNLLDNCSSGIEIVEIVFVALHPPLELADAYEDVISSQTDMKTRVLAANADREYSIAMAKASSLNIINRAKSYEETKTADSLGQANSFLSRTMAYRFEPELVRYRMRLEKMQRAFSSKKLYIVDNSVLEQENTFFLDLRDSDR
jgi:regulator of protease activity HflC (stomatin/prohibitin superfamily)